MTFTIISLLVGFLLILDAETRGQGVLAYRGTGRLVLATVLAYRGTGRLGCYRASERG